LKQPEFVIVGSGIAGGALATMLARSGASVVVSNGNRRIAITSVARFCGRGAPVWRGYSGSSKYSSTQELMSSAGSTHTTKEPRQRLANLGVALQVWANEAFVVQDPERRAARFAYIRSDEVLSALELSFATGFDMLPQDLTHADLAARLEACV
jgi:choline dehydrogenase-like flavoprotein